MQVLLLCMNISVETKNYSLSVVKYKHYIYTLLLEFSRIPIRHLSYQ